MNKVISVQQCKKCVDTYEDDIDNNDSDVFSLDNHIYSLNNQPLLLLCENEKCIEASSEIEKIEEDCQYIEKKIHLIDKAKSEEFFEISTKLSNVCKNINELRTQLEGYDGENLSNFSYDQLSSMELNLMSLLTNVRKRESQMEKEFIAKKRPIPEDKSKKCRECQMKDLDCILSPCSHVVMCIDCAERSIKCPICLKYIEYYDKVYLPEM